jgi:hypothetical protein
VQLRNVAQAGGSQVLDAEESEERLESQARRFELIVQRMLTQLSEL